MTWELPTALALVGIVGIFGYVILPRLYTILVVALAIGIATLGYTQLLAKPRPLGLEWESVLREAQVLDYRPVEGKSLYLWVLPRGEYEPRFYGLPWGKATQALAEAMQKAFREAMGGRVFLGDEDDGLWMPYPEPIPPMPPKELTTPPPPVRPRFGI